ncbi:hypothetical protein AB2I83_12880 [Escherichia coli]
MSDYVNTGVEAWKPNFYISADNKNITDKIRKGLINITLTDYGGSSKQTDELRVAIVSETLKIPARGVKISIGLGFGNQIIDKGIYIVDGASSGGEPWVVDFTAKAAPMNAWICPYISRHLLSLNPLQARCRRYSRGER